MRVFFNLLVNSFDNGCTVPMGQASVVPLFHRRPLVGIWNNNFDRHKQNLEHVDTLENV